MYIMSTKWGKILYFKQNFHDLCEEKDDYFN